MAYYSYFWQSFLEQNFTIVHWDQRGCGNTYYRNIGAKKPTLELLLSDFDDLVDYILSKYIKENIIIMGHSWGTFLGGIYAGKHPEKVSAYLSIGQMLDFKKSEMLSTQEAIYLATKIGKSHHAQKLKEKLNLILNCQKLDSQAARGLMKLRLPKEKYLPTQYSNKMLSLRLFSPYMTFGDFKWMFQFEKLMDANSMLYEALLCAEKLSMYEYNMQYECPVVFISGNNAIRNTGHIPFVDKPEDFAKALLKVLSNIL